MTIREQVIQTVLRDPSALRAVPPRGILHRAIRTDVVSVLPQAPVVGDEVYLTVDASTRAVANMLYLATGWVQIGAPPVVTALTTTGAADGVEVYYVADSANGVVWHLRYRAAGSASYPWEFVGGAEMRATNAGTSMTTTSATYVDLSTVGPTITAPLAGEYRVEAWAQAQHSVASALGTMALKIGSAATSDTNAVRGQAPAANYDVTGLTYSQIVTVSAASTVLKMQFKTNASTLTVNNAGLINPWMTIRPVRVGA